MPRTLKIANSVRANETVGVVNCAKSPKEKEPMIPGRGRRQVGRKDRVRKEDKATTGENDVAMGTKLIETFRNVATVTLVCDYFLDHYINKQHTSENLSGNVCKNSTRI